MTAKTLNKRVLEAKLLASLAKIEKRDNHGRVRNVLIPASNATINHVIIRRMHGGIISCECNKQAGGIGYVSCNGNLSGVCRHALAAIFVALSDQGFTPRFRRDLQDAVAYAKAHSDELLASPDTGDPLVVVLKSHNHDKNCLYFVAEENLMVELKKRTLKQNRLSIPPEIELDSLDKELQKVADRVDSFGWGGK